MVTTIHITYIHTYIHLYICTYSYTYIHTYIHTYIYKYVHTHIHCIEQRPKSLTDVSAMKSIQLDVRPALDSAQALWYTFE